MSDVKTKLTDQSPEDFLRTIEPLSKQEDSFTLLKLFTDITGQPARMWGSSIIGFGMYHYKSERSSQEGDWPLVGFSPRKQNLTLYIMDGNHANPQLQKLGKHKSSLACIYINKLADVDLDILSKLIKSSYLHSKNSHTK